MTKNKKPNLFTSRFKIGQRVKLKTSEFETDNAFVRAVTFSKSKVRYAVYLGATESTLHNVDSALLDESSKKGSMKFDYDNYS